MESPADDGDDDEVNSTIIAAIVIGCVGIVLMVLGSVFYLTRLGDVPSRKAVGSEPEQQDVEEGKTPDENAAEIEDLRYITPSSRDDPSPRQVSQPVLTTGATVPNPPSRSQMDATPGDDPQGDTAREELIEIFAPAGKLGFILGSPEEGGPPVVHEVRETSILAHDLQVGDRVIALDDEDVRQMSSNKVSKLIARRTENSTRKLSIIRRVVSDV